jgi:hypothetical protein
MVSFLNAGWAWFTEQFRRPVPALRSPVTVHISDALFGRVRSFVVPDARPEPLALVHVRYAAEDVRDAIVAVDAEPFPPDAYVEGPDGANFDVRWFVQRANDLVARNAGVMLAHMHVHRGLPCFSGIDRRTNISVISPLASCATVPTGALVLSLDHCAAFIAGEERDVVVRVLPRYSEGGIFA